MKYENTLKDAYILYKQQQKRLNKPDIGYKLFRHICEEFNKKIVYKIINEAYEFTMPKRLGTLRIRRFKHKIVFNEDGTVQKNKLKINWNETWKLRQRKLGIQDRKEIIKILSLDPILKKKLQVYFYNEHTDANIVGWYWCKYTAELTNKSVYKFKPTKDNKLKLGAVIKGNPNKVFNYSDFIMTQKYNL